MSMIKKLLALTLALAMVLSVSAFAGYSADTYADADKINEDCEDAIELLYALDIMKGDGQNFNPEATVTRQEMAKMIYVILNYGDDDNAATYTGAKMFSDVQPGSWSEGYINYAAATKLVQGRPDGTFGPTDPVTTAEAAKMLLTAIGYSSEARGYVGANWDKNVLSDAAIIGLLDGYKSNVNTYAPRQWVAVMVANALEALTFETMRPSFTGLLTSGKDVNYPTMGAKYYGITIYEGYLVGANGYKIDSIGSATNKSGRAIIEYTDDDGNTAYVSLKTSVSIDDLGQHFKVITVGGSVVSMRNTGKSVVGDAVVKDVEWELTYNTSDNKAKNRYEFTIGELTGKVNVPDTIALANVLDIESTNKTYETLKVAELQAAVDAANGDLGRNDLVRAIDRNDDGDIDYVIYTPVDYAYITKTGTSQKYGDYVRAVGADGDTLTISGGSNLYLNDVVYSEDDLEKGNVVKYTWDIDEGMFKLEVLPVEEAVEFESRKSNKNQFTFGGETYGVAENAFDDVTDDDVNYGNVYDTLIGAGALDKDFDIVVDGDLLVYVAKTDDNYTSMDEVNANLAVLIKADVRNTDDENDKQVKLLTIDGEQAWYAYNVSGAKKAETSLIYDEDEVTEELIRNDEYDTILTWTELKPDDDDENEVWDQLVIVHTNDDGEVYLELLEDKEDLNLETNLVDKVQFLNDTLEVDDGKAEYDNKRIGADYSFFAYVDDEYTVITMADLENGDYAKVSAKAALINGGNYYDSIVGGYLVIGDAVVSEDGYLYVTSKDGVEDEDGKTVSVMFSDGTEADVYVTNDADEYSTKEAYYYTFNGKKYTLYDNWVGKWTTMNVEAGDEMWYQKDTDDDGDLDWTTIDLGDYDIYAVTTIEKLLDMSDIDPEWETTSKTVEFVSAEDLVAQLDEYVTMLDNDDYTYSFDYSFCYDTTSTGSGGDDTLYITVVMNMVENNENNANVEQ